MKNTLPAVTAYTRTGKAMVSALKGLLYMAHWAKGKAWATPPPYFHDDPRHYTTKDLLFFAYKYYFKSPLEDEANGEVKSFFKENPPIFNTKNLDIQSEISLTAAGDLMPYEWIQTKFCPYLWDDIGDDFFSSDIVFGNLETPIDITRPAALVPEVMLSDMLFNADEAMFSLFNPTPQYKGFDVLSTANNHSLDMGEQGIFKTIEFLNKKNIRHMGMAKNADERQNFPIIEKGGVKIAFIAYTFSMNQMTNPKDKPYLVNHLEVNQSQVDLTSLKKDITYAKDVLKADFIILSLHYGNAYQAYPGEHIIHNTKRIFDECGPDMILGGHPHNIQPMARYDFKCPFTGEDKEGFVIFSFGDFIAYDIFNWCHIPVYLKIKIIKYIDNQIVRVKTESVEAVPVYACGVYKNHETRDLRLLNAHKYLAKINNGEKPHFMTDWNIKELRGLMDFYNQHFAQNLK